MLFKKHIESSVDAKEVKHWHLIVLGIIVVAFIVVRFLFPAPPTPQFDLSSKEIQIGTSTLHVLVADDPDEQYEGLSDRDTIAPYDGMLFVFPSLATRTFVMRRMRFPLDMIWVNQGMIVDIKERLPLEPGASEAQLRPYTGNQPSDMVFEVPSGTVAHYGWQVGGRLLLGY